MAKMFTVNEAAKFASKHPKTIRRWLSEITGDPKHPGRDSVQPSVQEEKEIRANKKPLTWTIEERLVRERFFGGKSKGSSKAAGKSRPAPEATEERGDSEIQYLRDKLDDAHVELEKERQHNRKMGEEQNSRQREMNHVVREFQLRLDAGMQGEGNVVTAEVHPAQDVETNKQKSSKATPTPKKRDTKDEVIVPTKKQPAASRRWFPSWANHGPAVRFDTKRKAIEFFVAKGE